MEDYSRYDNNELLIEQQNVRQHNGEPIRRIFFSKLLQIDFWYEDDNSSVIMGTQITLEDKNVITALRGKPISFSISEENPNLNQTAILRKDGYAHKNQIEKIFIPLIDQLPELEFQYIQNLLSAIKRKYN